MKEIKTNIVTVPGWAEHLQSADKITNEANAYSMIPLVYRAINIRCNALTAIPFRLMYGEKEKVWDDTFLTPLMTLMWKTQAAQLLAGAAYWLKIDANKKRMGAQWLNPFTVTVKANQTKREDGSVEVTKQFTQRIGSATFGPWTSEEMVHFTEFNPKSDITGLGAASVALGSSKLMYYLRSFASQFFENGAMPVTVLGVDINTGTDDIERARSFFERMTTGIKKAFGVIALRGDVKPTTITPALNTLAMPEIRSQVMQDIAWAFGIPETMLTDAANYATAAEHRRSFYEDTVNPAASVICDTINRQFLADTGMKLEPHIEEMDIFQDDENARASSLASLVEAGIPIEAAFEILGFEVSEESLALIRNAISVQETSNQASDITKELNQWKRKAIKQLEKNGTASVNFISNLIPKDEFDRINSGLTTCKTKEAIARLFDEKPKPVNIDGLITALTKATEELHRE